MYGAYACSSACFAYDCDPKDCSYVDAEDFCKRHVSNSGDNMSDGADNEDYESDVYSDICAFASS